MKMFDPKDMAAACANLGLQPWTASDGEEYYLFVGDKPPGDEWTDSGMEFYGYRAWKIRAPSPEEK